ncbi:hypothetical protein ANN_17170 [Periplaneta americana]|uniref:Uncharacterized protein n=1 Tax=Periplaneta americana TaxID=6978 RepID=A0ABQ8SS63_PERAM|nr:hypothetical protein ANN_17170 [Periplaneta americana]
MSLENSIFLHFRRGVLPKCERSCLASTAFILKITYRYVRKFQHHTEPRPQIVSSTELLSIVRSRNMFAFSSDERAFNIESYFRTELYIYYYQSSELGDLCVVRMSTVTGTEFHGGIRRRYINFFEWRVYILRRSYGLENLRICRMLPLPTVIPIEANPNGSFRKSEIAI